MKQYLKPWTYKQWEVGFELVRTRLTACLLKNEPTSYRCVARLSREGVAEAKASLNRASESHVIDPKPSDLSMGRVKRR